MVKLSSGAQLLKRGDTFDPDDARRTSRLRIARSVLAKQGIIPTLTHCEDCWKHPNSDKYTVRSGFETGYCWDKCITEWSGNPSDEIFNKAYEEADRIKREERVA